MTVQQPGSLSMFHLTIESLDLLMSRDLWAVLVAGVFAVVVAIGRKRRR
jgi:hypothetical protein